MWCHVLIQAMDQQVSGPVLCWNVLTEKEKGWEGWCTESGPVRQLPAFRKACLVEQDCMRLLRTCV